MNKSGYWAMFNGLKRGKQPSSSASAIQDGLGGLAYTSDSPPSPGGIDEFKLVELSAIFEGALADQETANLAVCEVENPAVIDLADYCPEAWEQAESQLNAVFNQIIQTSAQSLRAVKYKLHCYNRAVSVFGYEDPRVCDLNRSLLADLSTVLASSTPPSIEPTMAGDIFMSPSSVVPDTLSSIPLLSAVRLSTPSTRRSQNSE